MEWRANAHTNAAIASAPFSYKPINQPANQVINENFNISMQLKFLF